MGLTTFDLPTCGVIRGFSDRGARLSSESLAFTDSFNPHRHLVRQALVLPYLQRKDLRWGMVVQAAHSLLFEHQ